LGPLEEQRIQDAGSWGRLPVGSTLTKGESLFPRVSDEAS
jgi:methionyl-tRNA synthetase